MDNTGSIEIIDYDIKKKWLYSDPEKYLRRVILPSEQRCLNCGAELVIHTPDVLSVSEFTIDSFAGKAWDTTLHAIFSESLMTASKNELSALHAKRNQILTQQLFQGGCSNPGKQHQALTFLCPVCRSNQLMALSPNVSSDLSSVFMYVANQKVTPPSEQEIISMSARELICNFLFLIMCITIIVLLSV